MEAIGGDEFTYTIEFGTDITTLNRVLMGLIDNSKKIEERDDEAVTKLENIIDEEVQAAQTSISSSLTTPPYEWGPGGSPQAFWNLFEWG